MQTRNLLGPERYALEAGDSAEAVLVVPADAQRERRFEIAVQARLRCGDLSPGAWHELAVLADGALQWRRRVPTQNPRSFDGLDYRFARTVPVGHALRLVVRVACGGGGRRDRLLIEADEV